MCSLICHYSVAYNLRFVISKYYKLISHIEVYAVIMEVAANFMLWMLVQTANNNEVSMGNSGMLPIT